MNDVERLAQLAQAWDEAAAGYEQYFVPRFAPWVTAAVDELTGADLPPGPILVPCCGTFPELPELTTAQPGRELVGIDLSPGMVRLARARAGDRPHVQVLVGDAATLDPRWSAACPGVVSVFGLQQLPDQAAALANWVDALQPGGRLCVVLWPAVVEETGPFELLSRLMRDHRPPPDLEPDALPAAVTAAGGTVVRDEFVAFPMSHPDAATFWSAATTGGSLRAFARAQPPEVVAALRAEFLAQAPAGPWSHLPRARCIVATRS